MSTESTTLRERLGLDPLYWTILDDGPVEECVALIGKRAETTEPTAGWESRHLRATLTAPTGDTDDGEAIASHDGWIYVFGSGYGKKEGPLEPERSFVARFHEDDVQVDDDGAVRGEIHAKQSPFVLHRVVNDALHSMGADLLAVSPRFRRKTLGKARKRAVAAGADWAWRLQHDDAPINIEGAAFRENGNVLLGLRFPVARGGNPIVVEVSGCERMFDPALEDPEPVAVYVVTAIGSRPELSGIRDLHLAGDTLEMLIGNLDSDPDDSILLSEHPEAATALSSHWRVTLPDGEGLHLIEGAEHIHTFEGLTRVEGLAVDADGHYMFVSDEDNTVRTRFFGSGEASVT